jgi:hypothetical protein
MTKHIRCQQCNVKVEGDKCTFANLKRVINEQEYAFCCQRCLDKYEEKAKE